ncbi:MAG: adenylate/guanylate cyclase domain-containing protein [Desulfopila sp.]
MPLQNILVVDTDAKFTDLCCRTLGTTDREVICATTPEQALLVAKNRRFGLVIVAGTTDSTKGCLLYTLLRDSIADLAGILVMERPSLGPVMTAMQTGFTDVLEKPVSAELLVKRVQAALTMIRLRQENTRLKTLIPLYQLGKKFMSVTSASEIYDELVMAIHNELGAATVTVMLFERASNSLRIVASRGVAETIAQQTILRPGEKIAGWVFAQGEPLILNRRTQDTTPFAAFLQRKDISASISYPLFIRGEVAGVVNISNRDNDVEYSGADIELLSVICSQAVMALENVRAMVEREQIVRLRTMLEQYVAPEVAEFLLNREEQMLDVGEVKNLTVLFADIRNFTGLVQHISPEDLRLFLNQFFELFTNIVFAARGTLDKFMGDAALVLFGAPVPIEAPAEVAVSAAMKILQEFETLRAKWADETPYFNQIGIGIGISSGEMYLGNIGSDKRLDFTVVGTNVNIAQRLASATTSGQILITESVVMAVSNRFSVEELGLQQFKGMDEKIRVYSVPVQQQETVKATSHGSR